MAPSTDAQNLGASIRQARADAGLTQAELADFVGADRHAVAALERGDLTTQVRRLLAVLDAVGLDIELRPRTERLATLSDLRAEATSHVELDLATGGETGG